MKPDELRDLLPWYAAGSLEREQARKVEAWLGEQPEQGRELAEWRALQSVVAEVGEDEPAFRPELIEEAHRRIDAYEQTRGGANRAAKRGERRVNEARMAASMLLERIFGVWQATPLAARIAVAAQFAVLAVLIGIVGVQLTGKGGFTTASGGGLKAVDGRRITVVFQPERSLSEIQALLDETGSQIVAGPSGQGAYVLDLGKVDEARYALVLDTLRRNSTLVRYAAPVE
jgi:anti-sigma factor RsiW